MVLQYSTYKIVKVVKHFTKFSKDSGRIFIIIIIYFYNYNYYYYYYYLILWTFSISVREIELIIDYAHKQIGVLHNKTFERMEVWIGNFTLRSSLIFNRLLLSNLISNCLVLI